MAHYRAEFVEPARAASQINCWEPVRGLSGASSIDETIIPARGSANPVIGISIATVASPGDGAAYVRAGRAKGIAAASVGAFAPVGADASGMLRPLTAGAAASVIQQSVGMTLESGAAGGIITILVKPEQFL